jgi:hypothetical protein
MTATAETSTTATLEFASSGVKLAARMARGVAILRSVGPYAVIEILLPGGTLLALLLWMYRWRKQQKLERQSSPARAVPRTATQVIAAAAA